MREVAGSRAHNHAHAAQECRSQQRRTSAPNAGIGFARCPDNGPRAGAGGQANQRAVVFPADCANAFLSKHDLAWAKGMGAVFTKQLTVDYAPETAGVVDYMMLVLDGNQSARFQVLYHLPVFRLCGGQRTDQEQYQQRHDG